ncbi:cadherin-7-like [Anneissia japonica]|uniref:cadherin-7-like n=1 Tax=Anneissia japonica TaxID=1529436 RepID=UPI0014256BAE|nr:cadherin-7-like [Anneissia japonica]
MTLAAINDNEPTFNRTRYEDELHELALIGTEVNNFDCSSEKTDKDIFDLAFSITASCAILEPDNPPFEFKGDKVIVNSTLDFELHPTYYLTIQITEEVESVPKKGGNTTLVITVIDGDDLNPAFEKTEYELDVDENQTDWTANTIRAYDQDLDINAYLMYSFSNTSLTSEYFSIDPDTGNISMTQAIDRERNATLDPLIVKATQVDNYQRVGSARIVFNVIDVNDNCPKFQYSSYTGYVYELCSVGETVAANGTFMGNLIITASDLDEIFIGDFTTESDEFVLEVSDSDTSSAIIKVKNNASLNCSMYEGCNKVFKISITMTDGSCTDTAAVSIMLVEINNHDPVMEPTYNVNIQENTTYESIIQIIAADEDSGPDGQIDYSIVSAYSSSFDIDATTGEIHLKDTLDAEKSTEYRLVVQACDKSEKFQRRCTFADVEVFVEDVNEFPPFFLNDEFEISVYENEHCTNVFTAMGNDNDVTANLSYALMGPGSDDFSINRTTGDVQLLHTLDREVIPIYNLMIYVNDGENTAVCNLSVVVEDANDNYPDVNSLFYFEIQENSPAGSTLISINARDADVEQNKALTYHIYDSSLADLFSLDPDSGIFTTRHEMDRENQSSYNVIVIVRDNSTELYLYNLTTVEVNITDVNDNPPIIDSPLCGSDFHVMEGLTGELLGQIDAHDNDEPGSINAEILYELSEIGDALTYFRINNLTGELSTTEIPIDREKHNEFLLNVTIFEFSATDEDIYPNNIVIFNITEESESGHHFYIENDVTASSGKVKISNAPASNDESYVISIGVYNIDDTQLINGNRSTVEVRIISSPYSISILPIENVTVYEYETGNVTTIYVDAEGNLDDVAYNISQTFAKALFSVVPSTGDILLLLSPLEIALLTGYPASSIKIPSQPKYRRLE